MSYQCSTESIIRQMCSGVLSGGVIGALTGAGHYFLSYVTFTSIGFIDVAYHLKYLKAHITHLTYDDWKTSRAIRSTINDLHRTIQRELRDPSDDANQELRWLWNDIRRQFDQHIYYGMGFTMGFLLTVVLVPKRRR